MERGFLIGAERDSLIVARAMIVTVLPIILNCHPKHFLEGGGVAADDRSAPPLKLEYA